MQEQQDRKRTLVRPTGCSDGSLIRSRQGDRQGGWFRRSRMAAATGFSGCPAIYRGRSRRPVWPPGALLPLGAALLALGNSLHPLAWEPWFLDVPGQTGLIQVLLDLEPWETGLVFLDLNGICPGRGQPCSKPLLLGPWRLGPSLFPVCFLRPPPCPCWPARSPLLSPQPPSHAPPITPQPLDSCGPCWTPQGCLLTPGR